MSNEAAPSKSQQRRQAAQKVTVVEPQPRNDYMKVRIDVTLRSGKAWEDVELNQDELKQRVSDILKNGFLFQRDGKTTIYPPNVIEKIEIIQL